MCFVDLGPDAFNSAYAFSPLSHRLTLNLRQLCQGTGFMTDCLRGEWKRLSSPYLQAAADLMGQMDVYAVITYGSVSAKMNPNEHLARQRRVHV